MLRLSSNDGSHGLVGTRVLLLILIIGLAWAYPDVKYPQQRVIERSTSALHPFAKYKDLVGGLLNGTLTESAPPAAASTPLECFQVTEPVLTPPGLTPTPGQALVEANADITDEPSLCTVVLMEHTFENSYGAPFVGNYTPPSCDFDRVVINFTVLVKGRQYDRTGVMYLGDTEVWRTSTAEPTSYGIRWLWLKDMTPFLSMWKEPQTIIFDLENIVNDIYTGLLNTTLTATFFKSPVQTSRPAPADLVIPITERAGSSGEPSQFNYPEENASNTVSFPQNVNRAVFSVDVKGQDNEEFWWSNVPQSAIHTFDGEYGTYPGYSPWREVQVLIDDQLAGITWPFPVIYTGGVVPQLHRPIVGMDAFDIREHEIDITPWLPLLCDGDSHTFAIKIVGLDDDGVSSASLSSTTESLWYVTGKILLWLDDEDSITSGTLGDASASDPTITFSQSITQNSTGANETLEYNISVYRSFAITSVVKTQNQEGTVTWTQSLSYSNTGNVYGYGYGSLNTFSIAGVDAATGPNTSYSTSYNYPLYCNTTSLTAPDGALQLWAELRQGLDVEVRGDAVFPTGLEAFEVDGESFQASLLSTWRNGTAFYARPADNSNSTGLGQTDQIFSFRGLIADGTSIKDLYYRNVSAYNDTVVNDYTEVLGKPGSR
ncbi:peptide N-acetyl-beta-D-glucosaminyl asparaginase amidase A-domain-containing protein [Xylariaceae sp. FL0662B]|nr:peptide N-acetyl-beta-D-glucosaminyl asparaginase amidase A-domain-containing protein [Xylariaceae sp. FL0662B]